MNSEKRGKKHGGIDRPGSFPAEVDAGGASAEQIVERLARDFRFALDLEGVWALLLFGSWAGGEATPRSDVDLCVVAPDARNMEQLLSKLMRGAKSQLPVQLHIFELLPLRLKIEVIRRHRLVLLKPSTTLPDLHLYFYQFRKLWKDQEARNTLTPSQALQLLHRKMKS